MFLILGLHKGRLTLWFRVENGKRYPGSGSVYSDPDPFYWHFIKGEKNFKEKVQYFIKNVRVFFLSDNLFFSMTIKMSR
jgi:hypothetical protein